MFQKANIMKTIWIEFHLKIETSWKVDGLNMKLKESLRVNVLNNLEPQHDMLNMPLLTAESNSCSACGDSHFAADSASRSADAEDQADLVSRDDKVVQETAELIVQVAQGGSFKPVSRNLSRKLATWVFVGGMRAGTLLNHNNSKPRVVRYIDDAEPR